MTGRDQGRCFPFPAPLSLSLHFTALPLPALAPAPDHPLYYDIRIAAVSGRTRGMSPTATPLMKHKGVGLVPLPLRLPLHCNCICIGIGITRPASCVTRADIAEAKSWMRCSAQDIWRGSPEESSLLALQHPRGPEGMVRPGRRLDVALPFPNGRSGSKASIIPTGGSESCARARTVLLE